MSFFGDLGEGSIWDSGLDLFQKSGVAKLLEAGPGGFTLEALLDEDEFIQETQAQSAALKDFLASKDGLHGLLYYLTVPQDPAAENRAFRYPYMACEALCCAVPALLDALTDRTVTGEEHLLTHFAIVQPALRQRIKAQYAVDRAAEVLPGSVDPFLHPHGKYSHSQHKGHASHGNHSHSLSSHSSHSSHSGHHAHSGAAASQHPASSTGAAAGDYELRPYLAAYWSKVTAMLCKKRPAALVRFLDRTPGVAAGFAAHIANGSVASLLSVLLDLPFHSSLGMGKLKLCRSDAEDVPALLLSVIDAALQAALAGGCTSEQGSAAGNAASVLTQALNGARCTPHAKFGDEQYNAHRLAAARAGPGTGASADAVAAAAAAAAAAAQQEFDVSKAMDSAVDFSEALCAVNLPLDPTFHSNTPAPSDRVQLRLLKALRDGHHAQRVVHLAVLATEVLSSHADKDTPVPSAAGAACDAAFRVLQAVLDAAAFSYKHQAVLQYGDGSSQQPLTACPRVLHLLLPVLPSLTGYLSGVSTAALAVVTGLLNATDRDAVTSLTGAPPAAPPAAAAAAAGKKGKPKAPAPGEELQPGVAPPPSSRIAPTLGVAGLSLTRALAALSRCGWSAVESAAQKAGLFSTLLDTMSAFPWHSILHRVVADAVIDGLRDGREGVLRQLLFDARLLSRLVAGCRLSAMPAQLAEVGTVGRPTRVGYTGHLLSIASTLTSLYARGGMPGSVEALVTSHSDWWQLLSRELAVASVRTSVLIGGMAPDTKQSGNVGSSADATGGSKAAVDEVAALEGKDGEGGREGSDGGSSGSRSPGPDSDDEERAGSDGEADSGLGVQPQLIATVRGRHGHGHGGLSPPPEEEEDEEGEEGEGEGSPMSGSEGSPEGSPVDDGAGFGAEGEEQEDREEQQDRAREERGAARYADLLAASSARQQQQVEEEEEDGAAEEQDAFGAGTAAAAVPSHMQLAEDEEEEEVEQQGGDFEGDGFGGTEVLHTFTSTAEASGPVTATGATADPFGFDDAFAAAPAPAAPAPTTTTTATAADGDGFDAGFDGFGESNTAPAPAASTAPSSSAATGSSGTTSGAADDDGFGDAAFSSGWEGEGDNSGSAPAPAPAPAAVAAEAADPAWGVFPTSGESDAFGDSAFGDDAAFGTAAAAASVTSGTGSGSGTGADAWSDADAAFGDFSATAGASTSQPSGGTAPSSSGEWDAW